MESDKYIRFILISLAITMILLNLNYISASDFGVEIGTVETDDSVGVVMGTTTSTTTSSGGNFSDGDFQAAFNTNYTDGIWSYNQTTSSSSDTWWDYNTTVLQNQSDGKLGIVDSFFQGLYLQIANLFTVTNNNTIVNLVLTSGFNNTYNSTYDEYAYNQTTTIPTNYLNLSGTNANQNMNVSPYNITAGDFIIPSMTGNNGDFTLNHFFKDMTSAGRILGGEIVDNGGGTVIVTSGTGLLRDLDDDHSQVKFYLWDNSSAINIPTDSIMYVGIDLNGGSPIVVNYSSDDNFDLDTSFPLGTIINQKGELSIMNNPWWVGDGLTNVIERFQAEGWLERDDQVGGLILGYTGTRNPTLTAGTLWSRLTEHEIPKFDASDGDDFNYYYQDGAGSYNEVADQTQWNITTWDDGGALTTIGNNKYAVIWVWVNVGSNEIALMYPQAQYSNSASAEAEEVPEFPAMWYKGGVIVGRILIQEGEDVPVEIQSAFTQTFTATQASDHGNLAGLTDDDHTQYLLTNGDRAMTGDLSIGGYQLTNVGVLVMEGLINSYNIIPITTNLYTLGNSTNRFKEIFVGDVNAYNVNSNYANITIINSTTLNSNMVESNIVNSTQLNSDNLSVGGSQVYVQDGTTFYKATV